MATGSHRPLRRRIPTVVLLIESSRSSGRSLLRGIADYARDRGPWAFYWEPGGLEQAGPKLRTLEADGIILRDVEWDDEVLGRGIPAIVVGHSRREVPGVANVITDSAAIGAMAADHLLRCGFRHFAFCGLEGVPWSDLRREHFQQHLDQAGHRLHVFSARPEPRPAGWVAERRHLIAWVKSLPKPVGVLACNDDRGEEVSEACKMAGIHVPDDLGILGADNDEIVCDLADPPLSSVAINFERAGYESARVLDRLMARELVEDVNITVAATHVVPRRSTDTVSVTDQAVRQAIRFIRDRAREPIAVPDVARAAGVSRRVLEKRVQRVLRRSVLTEIRRARVEAICRMLVETNQSVAQIALALGFAGPEHIARYFRAEKGMTPLIYRRRHGKR